MSTITILLSFFWCNQAQAETPTLSVLVGTDIPYQHSLGTELRVKDVRFSLRTGLLVDPYSGLTLDLLDAFGTEDVYIRLLEASYQFGTMNGLGMQYLFGKKKLWYVGPELRFDYVAASDTSSDLIEAVVGESRFNPPRFGVNQQEIYLGLWLFAAGLRTGRVIPLGKNHNVHLELSFYKHYRNTTILYIDDQENKNITTSLNDLLWEDVFKPYGYLGGLGLAYSYSF